MAITRRNNGHYLIDTPGGPGGKYTQQIEVAIPQSGILPQGSQLGQWERFYTLADRSTNEWSPYNQKQESGDPNSYLTRWVGSGGQAANSPSIPDEVSGEWRSDENPNNPKPWWWDALPETKGFDWNALPDEAINQPWLKEALRVTNDAARHEMGGIGGSFPFSDLFKNPATLLMMGAGIGGLTGAFGSGGAAGGATNAVGSLADFVGSDWAAGLAGTANGGLLPTTAGGLTAANTAASSGVLGAVNSGLGTLPTLPSSLHNLSNLPPGGPSPMPSTPTPDFPMPDPGTPIPTNTGGSVPFGPSLADAGTGTGWMSQVGDLLKSAGVPNQLLKGVLSYLQYQNASGNFEDAAKTVGNLGITSMNPDRQKFKPQLDELMQSPQNFFNTNPAYKALSQDALQQFNANSAKMGYGGKSNEEYLRALMSGGAGLYDQQIKNLLNATGYNFSNSGASAAAPLYMNSAGTGSNIMQGFSSFLDNPATQKAVNSAVSSVFDTVSSWFV